MQPRRARAFLSSKGVHGEVLMEQPSPFAPTELTLSLEGLAEAAGGFHVHEMPVGAPVRPGHETCPQALGHYNPTKVEPKASPPPGLGQSTMGRMPT